ncbi:MAG: hypothetical protein V3S64_03735, partial [bacterium]
MPLAKCVPIGFVDLFESRAVALPGWKRRYSRSRFAWPGYSQAGPSDAVGFLSHNAPDMVYDRDSRVRPRDTAAIKR